MSYKYNLSVCVCVKNEAKYINEFLQHYVNQGVEHFYIINNKSSDNIVEILNNHKYKELITLFEDDREIEMYSTYNGKYIQKKIFDDYFLPIITKETKWAIIVDADEFMYGKNGYTIKTYLSTVSEDIGTIYVIWNIFLPMKNSNNEITEHFTIHHNNKRLNLDLIKEQHACIQFINNFGKSIIKTSMINSNMGLWMHRQFNFGKTITNYGQVNDSYISDNFNTHELSEEAFNKVDITLNHYPIRDVEDYEKRKSHLQYESKFVFSNGLILMNELDEKYIIEDNSIIN